MSDVKIGAELMAELVRRRDKRVRDCEQMLTSARRPAEHYCSLMVYDGKIEGLCGSNLDDVFRDAQAFANDAGISVPLDINMVQSAFKPGGDWAGMRKLHFSKQDERNAAAKAANQLQKDVTK
jgi:hypothetical protein